MSSNDERDRFGEKLKDAERGREDSYFAAQDRRLIEKLKQAAPADEATDSAAVGPCPKCGKPFPAREIEGVKAERCPACK